ncbi:hypothetical protein [Prauserella muralis]|uniref:Uncharacterized protein n=1 Tax=Prauserella muralis TaxID=588067 RepID=A0A2V4B027_9PSEU|nr:hypothetical protein [Prauserella muralis]PXY27343.1 hypothetical protein BAY60_12935 [Prauserella muralis]TWE22974.1 hypothetical protein FHX69_4232 [Prauserella muralis]
MGLPGNNETETETAAVLAARAEDAARTLFQRMAGTLDEDGVADPAELTEIVSSLKRTMENVARCLPQLSTWLEQRMWSGTLGDGDGAEFDELTKLTFETVVALARGHRMSAELGRELGLALHASRQLTAAR